MIPKSVSTDVAVANRGPNCYGCDHFAVSWDATFPYLCKLMGFKSRALPAIEVLRVDGVFCRGFEDKRSGSLNASPTVTTQRGRLSRQA